MTDRRDRRRDRFVVDRLLSRSTKHRIKISSMDRFVFCASDDGGTPTTRRRVMFQVRHETNAGLLLEHVLNENVEYERQGASIVTWTETNSPLTAYDSEELALSFQDAKGCLELWEMIARVNGFENIQSYEEYLNRNSRGPDNDDTEMLDIENDEDDGAVLTRIFQEDDDDDMDLFATAPIGGLGLGHPNRLSGRSNESGTTSRFSGFGSLRKTFPRRGLFMTSNLFVDSDAEEFSGEPDVDEPVCERRCETRTLLDVVFVLLVTEY